MSEPAKSCPSCGSGVLLLGAADGLVPHVMCTKCAMTGPERPTLGEAVAAWNAMRLVPAELVGLNLQALPHLLELVRGLLDTQGYYCDIREALAAVDAQPAAAEREEVTHAQA